MLSEGKGCGFKSRRMHQILVKSNFLKNVSQTNDRNISKNYDSKDISAALLIIGDEILSGRTKDENLNFLATNLTEIGIALNEVRVVPDKSEAIIEAVNQLRSRFDYVFTSGGIGPTHDDITSAAIAEAFGDQLIKNSRAEEILFKHYGKENVNEARLKMAYLPKSASLLDNPISSAPGFRIDNVFVMAGIPKIFCAMFEAAKLQLPHAKKMLSQEIKISLTESLIAKDLTELQQEFPMVFMGSYPFEGGTSLVFRSKDQNLLDMAKNKMLGLIEKINSESIIS